MQPLPAAAVAAPELCRAAAGAAGPPLAAPEEERALQGACAPAAMACGCPDLLDRRAKLRRVRHELRAASGLPKRCLRLRDGSSPDCGAGCVEVASDPKNCGACGNVV